MFFQGIPLFTYIESFTPNRDWKHTPPIGIVRSCTPKAYCNPFSESGLLLWISPSLWQEVSNIFSCIQIQFIPPFIYWLEFRACRGGWGIVEHSICRKRREEQWIPYFHLHKKNFMMLRESFAGLTKIFRELKRRCLPSKLVWTS